MGTSKLLTLDVCLIHSTPEQK